MPRYRDRRIHPYGRNKRSKHEFNYSRMEDESVPKSRTSVPDDKYGDNYDSDDPTGDEIDKDDLRYQDAIAENTSKRSQGAMVAASRVGSLADSGRGKETAITAYPSKFPIGLPDTANFCHKFVYRARMELNSDNFDDDFGGFDVKVNLNDPFQGVEIGTAEASDDGGFTRLNPVTAREYTSFLSYFETMYQFWTVLRCKVTIKYTDGGFWNDTNNCPPDDSSIHHFYQDNPYICYRDYGTQRPNDASIKDRNARQMMEDKHMACVQMQPNKAGMKFASGEVASYMHRSPLVAMIKKTFTHKSYERLMDIHQDDQDRTWIAVGSGAGLQHTFETFHRYWDLGTESITLADYIKYMMNIDITVEYDMQWKQLETVLDHAYYGIPTFPGYAA